MNIILKENSTCIYKNKTIVEYGTIYTTDVNISLCTHFQNVKKGTRAHG